MYFGLISIIFIIESLKKKGPFNMHNLITVFKIYLIQQNFPIILAFMFILPNICRAKQNIKNEVKQMTIEKAILAGGCFWGVEELFRAQPGVIKSVVGYTGGKLNNATYELVKTGTTGHAEALEVDFDSSKTNYEKILLFFFKMHDPTTVNQQGNDRGTQYRSAIFYFNEQQKQIAEKVITKVENSGVWKKSIVTEIVPAGKFWPAEEYHQDYLQKNPGGYTCHYVRKFDL